MSRLQRVSLWVLIGSASLFAFGGVVVLLFPDLPFEEEVLTTGALFAAYSVAGLGCGAAMRKGRPARGVLFAALVTLGLSLAVWLFLVWFDPHWGIAERIARVAGTLMIPGLVLVHAGLIAQMTARTRRVQASRWAAIGCYGLVAFMILALMWELVRESSVDEWYFRVMGVGFIVGSLATVLTVVFGVMDRADTPIADGLLGERPVVTLTCPRCGSGQEVRSGREARCGTCRLKIRVDVSEPRCACGYSLYKLASATCPECGREVREEDRWLGETHEHPGDD